MTEAEMEAMIEKAAAAGARTALREVGLSDEDANSDVRELRNLLDSFRSAKRTVGKTIVQGLTTLFLAALMAGAGIKRGSVYGESDKTGSAPLRDPVHPIELLATIYHSIGINPQSIVFNHLNQPRELVKADPVTALFG